MCSNALLGIMGGWDPLVEHPTRRKFTSIVISFFMFRSKPTLAVILARELSLFKAAKKKMTT